MLELSLKYGQGPVGIRGVAEEQKIPKRFLEQILLMLKRAGYVRSEKGKKGGYYLARPPEVITVAEVIRAMDGPLAPIECVSVTSPKSCPMEDVCSLRLLWKDVRDVVAGMLEKTTFADLAGRQLKMNNERRSRD